MAELFVIVVVFFIGRFSVRQDTTKRIRLDDVANWMIQAINACGGNHHDVRNLFQRDFEESRFINIDEMNNVKFVKTTTTKDFEDKNLLYDVFSSLREKINAPVRKKTN